VTANHYDLKSVPVPKQKLVHIRQREQMPDLGRDPGHQLRPGRSLPPPASCPCRSRWPWSEWTKSARTIRAFVTARPRPLDLVRVMTHLKPSPAQRHDLRQRRRQLHVWIHRYLKYTKWRNQLLPSAARWLWGASRCRRAIVHPIAGRIDQRDGCFMMCCQELATADLYGAKCLSHSRQ